MFKARHCKCLDFQSKCANSTVGDFHGVAHINDYYLGDSFAQSGDLCDPLQILSVRIGIDLKVGLQNLHLLFRKSRSHPFGFLLGMTFRIAVV